MDTQYTILVAPFLISERPKPKFGRYRKSRNFGFSRAETDTETEISQHTDTETDTETERQKISTLKVQQKLY